jgi:hypothetical protein
LARHNCRISNFCSVQIDSVAHLEYDTVPERLIGKDAKEPDPRNNYDFCWSAIISASLVWALLKTLYSRSEILMKTFIRGSILILTVCLAQSLLAGRSYAADPFAPSNLPDSRAGLKSEESFALSSPGQNPPQAEPTLLIGMIDDRTVGERHYSKPDNSGAADADGATANSSSPNAFEDYNLATFRKTPRYGFFSWNDVESFARTSDYDAKNSSTALRAEAVSEEDINTPSQPQTHFKPLAEIPIGNYRLPVYLGVRDAEHCCQ